MARRTGPSYEVKVPAQLQPFFTVNHFNVPLRGKGRNKKAKKMKASLHAMGRLPDPWHGKGKPTGK